MCDRNFCNKDYNTSDKRKKKKLHARLYFSEDKLIENYWKLDIISNFIKISTCICKSIEYLKFF